MFFELVKRTNWVDLLFILLLIRMCFMAVKHGFVVEVFKLLGAFFGFLFACHYYVRVGRLLFEYFNFEGALLAKIITILLLVTLASGGYALFVLFRWAVTTFFRMQAISSLDRWGSTILVVVRWFICMFLISLIFFLSGVRYLRYSAGTSSAGIRLLRTSAHVYKWSWSKIMSPITGDNELNERILRFEKIKRKKR